MKHFFTMIFFVFLLAVFTSADVINVPADQETIQQGINFAVNGDTVLVAEGTYLENINFMGKAIVVSSHYLMDLDTSHISNTIIDGASPSDADSGSVVFFISGEDTTSVLTGFTITNGSGTITQYTWGNAVHPIRLGGGILCYYSGARISHNKIMNNHIPDYDISSGGGIGAYPIGNTAYVIIEENQIVYNTTTGVNAWSGGIDLNCNATIKNNDISYNMSNATDGAFGAVGFWTETSVPRTVLVKNNRITHNQANGRNEAYAGGITLESGMNATITGNDISHNELHATSVSSSSMGAGIYLYGRTGTTIIDRNTISNNIVEGNTSTGGGIALNNNTSNSNTLITNNIISGNSASSYGGIHSRNSEIELINNTIVNNTATTQGGGFGVFGSSAAVVLNTIIWGNQAGNGPQIFGPMVIAYSNIEGEVWEGEGNISIDPLFEDTDTLFHLSDASPCIVAGADSIEIRGSWYHAPATDMSGDPRPDPAGSMPDMGAYENSITVAHAQSLTLSKSYVAPATDSLKVTTFVENPDHHELSLTADFQNLANEFIESLDLYDDGMHDDGAADDNVWGNYYIPGAEHTLKVSVTTNDNSDETSRTRPNLARFTSIGKIVFSHWSPYLQPDSVANPGDLLGFKIHLTNDGEVGRADYIEARLFSDDPRVEILSYNTNYNNIESGYTAESTQGNAIRLSEDFAQDTTIYLPITVSSGGFHFWDTYMRLDIFVTGLSEDVKKIPRTYALEQNYPNPFNPTTNITFALPKPENVKIEVFNTLGQRVETLVNKKMQAGYYNVDFNATNLASGVYMYKIDAGKFQDVKKMILLR